MQEKITSITWMNSGKIKAIDMNTTATGNKKDLQYDYDAMGNRVAKHVFSAAGVYEYSLYYIRDAQGNVISTYKKLMNVSNVTTSLKQTERHLYGSSRLGTDIAEIEMIGATSNTSGIFNHFLGQKVFEASNHLGNVVTTFTDKKVPRANLSTSTKIDFWMPELYSATDYYPFGQAMPGRNFELTNASKYRYGFNGKENDNEVKGQGNQQDYGMRIYDPRLGRFLSVDPIASKYPELTPYQFASNFPIWAVDLDGLEALISNGANNTIVANVLIVGSGNRSVNEEALKLEIANRILNQLDGVNKDIHSMPGTGGVFDIQLNYISKDAAGNSLTYESAVELAKNNPPPIAYIDVNGKEQFIRDQKTSVIISTDVNGVLKDGDNAIFFNQEISASGVNEILIRQENSIGDVFNTNMVRATHEIGHFLGKQQFKDNQENAPLTDHPGGFQNTNQSITSRDNNKVKLTKDDIPALILGAALWGAKVQGTPVPEKVKKDE